jgi:phosphate acetyltransferase
MTTSIYLSTLEPESGKALLALGIMELARRKTTKIGFFRPFIQEREPNQRNEDIELIINQFNLPQEYEESFGLFESEAINLINNHQFEQALQRIITKYKNLEAKCDFILCESSDYIGKNLNFELDFNFVIAQNFGCPLILLVSGENRTIEEITSNITVTIKEYERKQVEIIGIVVNKVAPEQVQSLQEMLVSEYSYSNYLLSIIPYLPRLNAPQVRDLVKQLRASILFGEDRLDNLILGYLVTAMQVGNALQWLKEGQLIITPGDRSDLILAMLQVNLSSNYPNLAGILLTGGIKPEPSVCRLIEGLVNPLPILAVETDTYTTAIQAEKVYSDTTIANRDKIRLSQQVFAQYINLPLLEARLAQIRTPGMTSTMFLYHLQSLAKSNPQKIVLAEGAEPRILKAASVLLAEKMADLVLLGRRREIEESINQHGINLNLEQLKIIEPTQSAQFEQYAQTFYQLRKHKGITMDAARDFLQDVSYFGTMMVYAGDADGMVSGAIHTTQNTIRPALQIIKTKPGFSLVSSVFFMCLETHILVYGDCAVNPNPNAEQLAEIALSSAETAAVFGIEPRVALLSYSSGSSGQGEDVEKVRQAVQIAQQLRPQLKLEGPMQYDAAVDSTVAAQKMPHSQLAGQATVLIFPDLNTGNNTYKAVQRETKAMAIGPILQGLNKPVNDLSRGCTVEDIINTVVITAIQAQNN